MPKAAAFLIVSEPQYKALVVGNEDYTNMLLDNGRIVKIRAEVFEVEDLEEALGLCTLREGESLMNSHWIEDVGGNIG